MQSTNASFARRGFYLHACWEFEYPFAVRTWALDDYRGVYRLLGLLGFDTVMLWPMMEAMPAPLADDDRQHLVAYRDIVAGAQECGLETWVVHCPNVTAQPEIAAQPFSRRHLYPFRIDVRLDDEVARENYLRHRDELTSVLNNADGYVVIDGDPGGYPNAQAAEFLRVMQADRDVLARCGTHPERQKCIPWLWAGWGSDWDTHGYWNEPLEPLTEPLLELLQREMTEPWELLPGRSFSDKHGNGRTMLALTEDADLIARSTLLCYEIIEFEPSPPAVVLQFEDIRRVLREEMKYAGEARGVLGNAQQPIMVLPNLYLFARATADFSYLERSDREVLADLAAFLGGPEELLAAAWDCLRLGLDELPPDLPARLRAAQLNSEAAQYLPGGPEKYLEILASFVTARLAILHACATEPADSQAAADALCQALGGLVAWWRVHRYVFSGERGDGFRLEWSHPVLRAPLESWVRKYLPNDSPAGRVAMRRLCDEGILTAEEANDALEVFQI